MRKAVIESSSLCSVIQGENAVTESIFISAISEFTS